MEDKLSNPFANLTPREHDVLRMIIRELKRPESPKRASEDDDSGTGEHGKSAPALKK